MPTLPQTISTNLTSLSDDKLLKYALTLVDGLTKSGKYASIAPTVADGNKLIQRYATALANAAKGGTAERMLRDSLRQDVESLLHEWSAYATDTTPGDVQAWADAHFNLTKAERTPRAPLAAPTKFVLADGPAKGSVRLSQNAQAGTKAYVYEYALMPAEGEEPQWHFCLGSTASCVVSDLTSGAQYVFRVGVWNGTGNPIYSATESRYVQ